METFCGGEPLWNSSLTWSDNRTWPEFTDCFQNTVLVWTSSGWLLVTLPFYLHYMLQQRTEPVPSSWRNLSKLLIALLQCLACILTASLAALDIVKETKIVWLATFTGPMLQSVTLVLVMILLELERRKGFITSGVLFIYWLLVVITSVIPFYSKLIQQEYTSDLLKFSVFNTYFGLSLIQLVLSCFAETVPHQVTGKAPCPAEYSSFLSRITFSWLTKLVVTGFKNALTEEDVYQLDASQMSRTVVPAFEKEWQKETVKTQKAIEKWKSKVTAATTIDNLNIQHSEISSERTPLLTSSSSSTYTSCQPATVSAGPESKSSSKSKDSKPRISLLKVLFRTFGAQILIGHVFIFFYDVLLFFNPLLLRSLIAFIEDTTQPMWQGFVLAGCLFLSAIVSSLCFHNCIYITMVVGIRVRAAIISKILNKSITMSSRARADSTVGEIVNLMSVDGERIRDVCVYLWGVWSSPLQIIVALIFLYYTVGLAMLAGLGVMLVVVPLNGLVTRKVQLLEEKKMECTDNRIKLLTEVLNGIKILKLYAWELVFGDKVMDIRKEEIKLLRRAAIIESFMSFSWMMAPFLVGLATFSTYIFIDKDHYLNAETAFVALSLFNILRLALNMAPSMIVDAVNAYVSIKRVEKFLNSEDLDFSSVSHFTSDDAITIESGTFTWDTELGPCLKNINLKIPKGSLVAVVGQVGMGKSSLISAILGEMEKNSGHVNVDGSIAYVPQEAWIQNATVRGNILFGKAKDEVQYRKVISACALKPDLDILAAEDLTEIGEKGINLSGGQRQRVSLARSVYFDSDIYLLDDPLSAVDSHVGKHIFQEVIGKEGLLQQKTRLLVTHGLQWLPAVDFIIVMTDGHISEIGSYEELMDHDKDFAQFLRTYLLTSQDSDDEDDVETQQLKDETREKLHIPKHNELAVNMEDQVLSSSPTKGAKDLSSHAARVRTKSTSNDDKVKSIKLKGDKPPVMRSTSRLESVEAETDTLIEEEELESGRVSWAVVMSYLKAVGIKYSILIIVLYALYQILAVMANIWLTNWTSDPDLQSLHIWPGNSTERRDANEYYLGIYGALGIGQAFLVLLYSSIAILRMLQAARLLHDNMLTNILRGPMSFFDTTPIGRIVNRFSQDVENIDEQIPYQWEGFLECLFVCISTFVVVTYSTPIFLTVAVPVIIVFFLIQRFFIPTSRQLTRLGSKTRSPIYNHFNESIAGASVIRAFGVQKRFSQESEKRVDNNQECLYAMYTQYRWLGVRLEFLGSWVVLAAGIFAVVERDNISGSLVGLSVSYALEVMENMIWLIRTMSELESSLVSVERVGQYTVTPTEADLVTSRRPGHDWPDTGSIQFKNFSVRYRDGLDLVLKGINITVQPGEKVGIVGRTGAGKSSLTISLFRLVEAAGGSIIIDGENISSLGLNDLRSRLIILPQEPVLFSGSLKVNLDPMNEHSDSALWVALEHAHLKKFVETLPTGIEYEVGEGGQNLSVGQRQLVCLARSLLKKSKILILDEATAAVDMETDELIQNTIGTEFKDCTVLTIAHRLNTIIDYDRILVLDQGEVKEFDTPQSLLQDSGSLFYTMAKDAGLA